MSIKVNENAKTHRYDEKIFMAIDILSLFLYGFQMFLTKIQSVFGNVSYPNAINFISSYNVIYVIILIKIYLYMDRARIRAIASLFIVFLTMLLRNDLYYVNVMEQILCLVALMLCADHKKIIKVYSIVLGIVLTVTFFSCYLGIITNGVTGDNYSARKVYLLGFSNRNSFMNYWFFLMLCLIYLFGNRLVCDFALIIITSILYYLTLSKSVPIIGFIFIFILIINNCLLRIDMSEKLKKMQSIIMKGLTATPVLAALITFLGVLFYDSFSLLNGARSLLLRFENIRKTFIILGLPLSAGNIAFDDTVSSVDYSILTGIHEDAYSLLPYCDNIYARVFIDYGVVVLVVVIAIMVGVMLRAYKAKDYKLVVVFSMMAIHGILECYALNDVTCSVLWIILLSDIWSKDYVNGSQKSLGRRKKERYD